MQSMLSSSGFSTIRSAASRNVVSLGMTNCVLNNLTPQLQSCTQKWRGTPGVRYRNAASSGVNYTV